ncbi:MAG TPA: DUF58 domain-containing protein [Capillimicrobium sp.]|nr:DUF58 domain-containing protein [Capillimicrobium sp.]
MGARRWLEGVDAGAGLRVLGLGVALLAAALLFDAEPLYVPGLVLMVLALLAGAWAALGIAGAAVERTLEARRVLEGEPLHARLTARGGAFGLVGAALEDPLLDAPYALPAGARSQRLRVDARFARRGRRELAPPALLLGDPLGLVSVRREAPGAPASVLVLPRIEPVVSARSGQGDGTGAGGRRSVGGAAEVELDGLRPWQPGTSASRIHWPALARGAGLVERRLLPEADARPLVVLDPRHPEDEAALDAAVRATASLAVHLARRGGCALLLPGDRRPTPLDAELHGWMPLHVRLALIEGAGTPAFATLSARRGPVLLVMARTPERPPRALVASPSGHRVLVVPGELSGRRASFRVAGCVGYELARAAAPAEAA